MRPIESTLYLTFKYTGIHFFVVNKQQINNNKNTYNNKNNKSPLLMNWFGPSFKVKFLDQQQQQN